MTNSASGGYLKPAPGGSTPPFPRSLSLTQFLQTVVVGVSGVDGTLVRPNWQIAPPKQPDIDVNWIAFGVNQLTPDTFAYVGMDGAGVTTTQRQEGVEVGLSIYGPEGLEIAGLIIDGLQIPQNLEALRAVNMGFQESTQPRQVPDLVNERWVPRVQLNLIFRRQITRTYPIVSILSASGRIHTVVGNEEYLLDWSTENTGE